MATEFDLETILKRMNPEILVTTKPNCFERSDLIPFIRFLYEEVLKDENHLLVLDRFDKHLKDIRAITATNHPIDPKLNEFLSDYSRFNIIKEDGKFDYNSQKAKLELTLVREGLLIKKGVGDNTELIHKLLDYQGSSGIYKIEK